ncbi:DUF3465 domain-containing protein [Formicincola oecophyllae]|uniref:DUF3465 domain-containing protein n=2 Tax=Formicincola oecophyllae TaxID=2558361 RepID=A0A4Y6UAF5_9PROT|nr:DUF3465 domain-containing protein [Formicincola oecophyllae]
MPPSCDNAAFTEARAGYEEKARHSFFRHPHFNHPEHVCGVVMKTWRARRTRSGWHGYFLLNIGNAAPVRIVVNLGEMQPHLHWPWVQPGDSVEVEGRYYFDSKRRQGIDWTHEGSSRRWPYTGFVIVNGQRFD